MRENIPSPKTKLAWAEIAIEWHTLATKTAVGIAKTLADGPYSRFVERLTGWVDPDQKRSHAN
jgi:hypothetical protein